MANRVETTFEELPDGAYEIGVSWENEAVCDSLIRETLASSATVYVVREYHYNGDQYEQWSDAYFCV